MKLTKMNVTIPESILLTLRESAEEFISDMKKWSAVKLFESNKLSLGQCAEFAEMTEEDFIKYLSTNNISIFRFNDDEELAEDLSNA